jgi:hypothetical protein
MHPEFAQVADAAHTRPAPTTCRYEAQHRRIALGDVGDAFADLHHDARALVSADHRHRHLQVAGDEVFV